jgi:hypothetical protein
MSSGHGKAGASGPEVGDIEVSLRFLFFFQALPILTSHVYVDFCGHSHD